MKYVFFAMVMVVFLSGVFFIPGAIEKNNFKMRLEGAILTMEYRLDEITHNEYERGIQKGLNHAKLPK